mmetsp:Transcript_7090/g.11306  ORF Transcript_7090/g.11306 Transcript_7090/m.11306 type:complete len:221 (-) Transcript_7090:288-950(-)
MSRTSLISFVVALISCRCISRKDLNSCLAPSSSTFCSETLNSHALYKASCSCFCSECSSNRRDSHNLYKALSSCNLSFIATSSFKRLSKSRTASILPALSWFLSTSSCNSRCNTSMRDCVSSSKVSDSVQRRWALHSLSFNASMSLACRQTLSLVVLRRSSISAYVMLNLLSATQIRLSALAPLSALFASTSDNSWTSTTQRDSSSLKALSILFAVSQNL